MGESSSGFLQNPSILASAATGGQMSNRTETYAKAVTHTVQVFHLPVFLLAFKGS